MVEDMDVFIIGFVRLGRFKELFFEENFGFVLSFDCLFLGGDEMVFI